MAHIKKLVAQGFKSFARKTEIHFDEGINVIIGPNGSGKSNISDALCFALGRLSAKSMRAEKAKNLIFMGSKYIKPASSAYVELHFDNSDKSFSIDSEEVILRRSIKKKGGGTYKINGEGKTRTEVIETLAQAGIDPYGFNLILQGQIQTIVKMRSEDRRKIIEEVAGISVYEWRKEKALKELEKTESRLKEVTTILRQRTAYLNNLEKEKASAQRYKDTQEIIKRAKASITKRRLEDKEKEINSLKNKIDEQVSIKDKKQEEAKRIQQNIDTLTEEINKINKYIRDSSGIEQSHLREEITDLRAELEGLKVRKEGQENRYEEIEHRMLEIKSQIPEYKAEIKNLQRESPLVAEKVLELKAKKEELAQIEKERKHLFSLKSELTSIKDRIYDKQKNIARASAQSDNIVSQMEELAQNLRHSGEEMCTNEILTSKENLQTLKNELDSISALELEHTKTISISEADIKRNEKIKIQVSNLDNCPLCQNKITDSHISHVNLECNQNIIESKKALDLSQKSIDDINIKKAQYKDKIAKIEEILFHLEKEKIHHLTIGEKKNLLKSSQNYEATLKKEISELERKQKSLENMVQNSTSVDERHHSKILEIEEISSRTQQDVDTTLLYKERELEKTQSIIERSKQDLKEIKENLKQFENLVKQKGLALRKKEQKEEELNNKFNILFEQRDSKQRTMQKLHQDYNETQGEARGIEEQVNYLKVGKAKFLGEKQTLELDLDDYKGTEILQGSLSYLEERLRKAQDTIQNLGPINMRALEVYKDIKAEYDQVKQKVDVLDSEKTEILKIIEEVDRKKKKTFMKTYKGINSLFSRNFSKLSNKGDSYLEIENKENLFEGGIDIVVKMAKGKYFDVNSLSGGEQTMVALALLFAIQEHKPYHFYILDEIDAALDKRNSERLALLLNQYMKTGQYIVITHNDAIILDSKVLYGISMHEGVSKVLSLDLQKNKT